MLRGAFPSYSEQRLLVIAALKLLITVTFLVVECMGAVVVHMGLVAPWPVGSSRPGLESVSPALQSGFFFFLSVIIALFMKINSCLAFVHQFEYYSSNLKI